MMKFIYAIAAVALMWTAPVQAQNGLPSAVRSTATLETIVTRGLECGLMLPWQGAAIRAQMRQEMRGWDATRQEQASTEIARLLQEHDCQSEMVALWIDGAGKGFDTEMLPPFLVAYRALAQMDAPPNVFSSVALRVDYAPVIAAIDAKLAALEASGVKPEGDMTWPAYVERTTKFIDQFVGALGDPNASREEVDQAAGWLAQTALIVELWMKEGA